MARSRYIYLVFCDDLLLEWAFTVKHEAVGAIHRSGYPPARLTMCRVIDGSRDLSSSDAKAVFYDVQQELIDGGYRKKES